MSIAYFDCFNGAAGDRVHEEKGYHLLPEDLVEEIPYVVEGCLRK